MAKDKFNEKVIILGAGKPHLGEEPSSLYKIGSNNTILNWLINTLNVNLESIEFVGGYKCEEIKKLFPEILITKNNEWDSMGSAGSFLSCKLDSQNSLLVSYGDVLYRDKVVNELKNSKKPIALAWDSNWKYTEELDSKYKKETHEKVKVLNSDVLRLGIDIPNEIADGKFIGLVRFSPDVIKEINQMEQGVIEFLRKKQLPDLIEYLRVKGFEIEAYDVKGDWAEVLEPNDIASFILGSKARTLQRLQKIIKLSTIQDQIIFTKKSWENNQNKIIENIIKRFGQYEKLIVRSSSKNEDGFNTANAGKYKSILGVKNDNTIVNPITEVIDSFGENGDETDEVLIQPLLLDVKASGVVFTRTLEHACPWLIINYEEGDDTASITSGISKDHKTCVIRKDKFEQSNKPLWISNLYKSVLEIEELLRYDCLDIEFAIDSTNKVHLFQVRPLICSKEKEYKDDIYFDRLNVAKEVWEKLSPCPPHIPGNAPSAYGLMPDWNPAEIIGTSPGELSLSLYKYLITDETWAIQRSEFGYREVRPAPLLVNFSGCPYVDIRLSFASFLPKKLSDKFSGKLLNYFLNYLKENKEYHDKVEFKVIPTCLAPNYKKWFKRLSSTELFNEKDLLVYKEALKEITINSFSKPKKYLEIIADLEKKNKQIVNSDLHPLEKARLLLEDSKRMGTLPFAHLARCGFIAINLLEDAVTVGAISNEAKESFLNSIKTVSKEFTLDCHKSFNDQSYWNDFARKYGHLRPGTYDINSDRYDSNDGYFLKMSSNMNKDIVKQDLSPIQWEKELPNFLNCLQEIGLPSEKDYVESFLYESIEGREYSKFIFTKNLSDALEQIAKVGEEFLLNRFEISNLNLNFLLSLRDSELNKTDLQEYCKQVATTNIKNKYISSNCKLPNIIYSKKDLDIFFIESNMPNFIGVKSLTEKLIEIKEDTPTKIKQLKGKIVIIKRADPGYDWLFSQGIAGLVTLYGGANSHMAIRSAEFGLPAAIGVGEKIFTELINSNFIQLDPIKKIIKGFQ